VNPSFANDWGLMVIHNICILYKYRYGDPFSIHRSISISLMFEILFVLTDNNCINRVHYFTIGLTCTINI